MENKLGERMKSYEDVTELRLVPCVPAVIRLDGRNFSRITRSLDKPYDSKFGDIMEAVTVVLAKETSAVMAYTQSDEISLVINSDNQKSQVYFDGRILKIVSTLAAIASVHFTASFELMFPDAYALPTFDCRTYSVPSKEEAANYIVWRYQDAVRNSISGAAQKCYPHNKLLGKSGKEKLEMLRAVGVEWNDFAPSFKYGAFYHRETSTKTFTAEEIAVLPEHHEARKNPGMEFTRSQYEFVTMPPFTQVSNRVDVIFNGAEPIVRPENTVVAEEFQDENI